MAPTGYILCSNPRSGTTLLCDLLTQTAVAGAPNSFFREKSLPEWSAFWGIETDCDPYDAAFTAEYFASVRNHARGDNETFGLRVMGADLAFLCAWLARAYPDAGQGRSLFEAAFGDLRFIHLKRHDKLAEAVSYVRAEQSGLWHRHADGSDMERIAPNGQDGYARDAIAERMKELSEYESQWDDWFAAEKITPLRLSYETLAGNPIKEVREALEFIDQSPCHANGVTPGVRKLADATNADWIARFRAET